MPFHVIPQYLCLSNRNLSCYQLNGSLSPNYPFQLKPIVFWKQDAGRHIRGLHAVIQERVRQELSKILGMFGRAVKDDISDASYFVPVDHIWIQRKKSSKNDLPFIKVKTLADQEEGRWPLEEGLASTRDVLVWRVSERCWVPLRCDTYLEA